MHSRRGFLQAVITSPRECQLMLRHRQMESLPSQTGLLGFLPCSNRSMACLRVSSRFKSHCLESGKGLPLLFPVHFPAFAFLPSHSSLDELNGHESDSKIDPMPASPALPMSPKPAPKERSIEGEEEKSVIPSLPKSASLTAAPTPPGSPSVASDDIRAARAKYFSSPSVSAKKEETQEAAAEDCHQESA